MRFLVFCLAVFLCFTAAPFLLHGIQDTASSSGLSMVAADSAGAAIAAFAMGSIGLLYKPNRFGGFVMATSIAAVLIFMGGKMEDSSHVAREHAQPDLEKAATPPTCEEVEELVHASLEMREMGLSAEFIADAAVDY